MHKWQHYTVPAVSVLLVLGAMALVGPPPSVAQHSPGHVTVTNHISQPVPTREVGHQARQVFQRRLSATASSGGNQLSLDVSVPAGKRLVVEHISAIITIPTGQKVLFRYNVHGPGGIGVQPTFFASHAINQFTSSGFDNFVIDSPTRFYADGAVTIQFIVDRNPAAGNFFVDIGVAGYLLDCTVDLPCLAQ